MSSLSTCMISLLVLLLSVDSSAAASVKRQTSADAGAAPVYPFIPDPETDPAAVVLSDRPMICNNRTEFECVCMLPRGAAQDKKTLTTTTTAVDCSNFILGEQIDVVDMKMRQVNTESMLYTGQTYEEYFKKRIASIISHYCQHNSNECPGTTLRMNQNNVVILRMEHLRGNITRLLFVILKDGGAGAISNDSIIDPIKIKYILASQVGPLSRVLGGIRIDSVRASHIKRNLAALDPTARAQRQDNLKDNSKLIKGLFLVLGFFLITYCIAFVQCLRWCYNKRKRAQKQPNVTNNNGEVKGLSAIAKTYGTCDNKRTDVRNGHLSNKDERTPLTYGKIDESFEEDDETRQKSLTSRQMRNWFTCDVSQLPREPTIDEGMMTADEPHAPAPTPQPTVEHQPVTEMEKPRKEEPLFSNNDAFSSFVENAIPETVPEEFIPMREVTPPKRQSIPAVLLQSSSLREDTPDIPIELPQIPQQKHSLGSESPPMYRPRSRRGSRIDEPEGTLDLKELEPLNSDDPLAHPLNAPILLPDREEDEDKWSSSEDGEVDVYYKMSDDEEVTKEEAEWKKTNNVPVPSAVPKKVDTPPSSPVENQDSDSEGEAEVEPKAEEDDFVYERLREELSPHPPIVVDVDTTDLDLAPMKTLPVAPLGLYPDSPPESNAAELGSPDTDSLR